VEDSSKIQTFVTGEQKADLCVLPVNLASKLLGDGTQYQMLGTVTHGNLYMLSTDGETAYTTDNLSALVGKTVGVVNLQNVPGLTLKVILNENNITWQELGNDSSPAEDKVNLKAIAADEVSPASKLDVYVAPEPAASVKVSKTTLEFVGDLQSLYGGDKGYPQAVLVAKKSFAEGHAKWIADFMTSMTESGEWLKTAEIATIVSAVSTHLAEGLTPSLSENNLSKLAISHSGVRFESSADHKSEVNAFLNKLIAVNSSAAAVVSDSFYYA
jgi:ABC-type nitrate/sulfonate/bicarbonate transport system substrate-binding protein